MKTRSAFGSASLRHASLTLSHSGTFGSSFFGLMMSLAVLGVGSLPVQAQNRPSSTNMTTQPQVPTWRQFVARGGGRYIQVDYDLPTEYRDGFVYFNQGASVINAFILKKGLSSYPSLGNDLSQIDFKVADQYIKSGKAIQFNWNLGNSGLRYINDTEVRFPSKGTGCFRTACLTAPFFSNAEISRILLSKRRITQGSQVATGRSPQVAQNINQFNRFIIGTLTTGEKVLRVPKEYLSQSPFKEASRQPLRSSSYSAIITDAVFLWSGRDLKFAGYDIDSITDFKAENQTYWVTQVRANDGSRRLEISKPGFANSRVVKDFDWQFIRKFQQDISQNGFYYASVAGGNGFNVPVITYLLDLRRAAANSNQSVIVCEVSRYTELRRGVSPSVDNPNCRNGQQVMARRSPSSDQSSSRTTSGQELVASNLGCTSNLRTILGQQARYYCTSADANSGILLDNIKPPTRNADRYTYARSADLRFAMQSGDKATITLRDAASGKRFEVRASQKWQKTGIFISSRSNVRMTRIEGNWVFNPGLPPCDADGDLRFLGKPGYALPGAPEGALVGKIKNRVFLIGTTGLIPNGVEGELLVTINDDLDNQFGSGYSDNSGSILIEINVQ